MNYNFIIERKKERKKEKKKERKKKRKKERKKERKETNKESKKRKINILKKENNKLKRKEITYQYNSRYTSRSFHLSFSYLISNSFHWQQRDNTLSNYDGFISFHSIFP